MRRQLLPTHRPAGVGDASRGEGQRPPAITHVARERLALMGDRCRAEYSAGQHNNLLIAKEIAARHARNAWTGEWWTATPCIAEPLTLSPGDEYFTRVTVCRIIEQMGEQVADRVG